MSKYELNETTEEQVARMKRYLADPTNGMNKSFLTMTIAKLENK